MTAPSEDHLLNLIGEARSAGEPLLVEGSGTKRHHGAHPRGGTALFSMRPWQAITTYEPGDMVVGVQTGIRLRDLQAHLAREGQWLPIDPPYAEATVGGILATSSNGPRRLGYGPVRDLVLGMRVIDSLGRVTKSGGRVVKNVTGYDLHKLQVGAFGTLGLLLEVNLKVMPLPEERAIAWLACPDLAHAHSVLLRVGASSLRPVALEALNGRAAHDVGGRVRTAAAGQALALIGIEGSRPSRDRHLRDLPALLGASPQVAEGKEAESLWEEFRDRARLELTVRLATRPHDLPALLADLALAALPEAAITVQTALGLARVELPGGTARAALVPGWQAAAAAHQGYAVVESAPLDLPARTELPWKLAPAPLSPAALGLALKQSWDPTPLFNPGRL